MSNRKTIPKAVNRKPLLVPKEDYHYEQVDPRTGKATRVHDIAPKFDANGNYLPPVKRMETVTPQVVTNGLIDRLVATHGEDHRAMITDVSNFIRRKEEFWKLHSPVDVPALVDHLLGKPKRRS